MHTRGFIIIESAIGFVAVMPIGMGHISSINFSAEEGSSLTKGEEFGFFAFGGSDIVMLFEAGKIQFTAKEKTHYKKQGEQIAVAFKPEHSSRFFEQHILFGAFKLLSPVTNPLQFLCFRLCCLCHLL